MTDEDYIQVTTRVRRTRQLTVAYNRGPSVDGKKGTKIAAIRFSGSYLEDMGFAIGNSYSLRVNEDNTITLTPIVEEAKTAEASSE